MIGDKYRIPGRRTARIFVKPVPFLSTEVYRIYQGAELFMDTLGGQPIPEMTWTEMSAAQSFLDRLAKVRGWKKVSR